CSVETEVDDVGEYVTPSCALPSDGYYVWTERIDPARTDPGEGGERLRSWTSRFGVASEITRVVPASGAPAALPGVTELAETGTKAVVPAL
ncbi:hypothetical protein SB717_35970, partial [Priestia sp. SIMBA_032]